MFKQADSALDEVQSFNEKKDKFKTEIGTFIKDKAENEMQDIDNDVKEMKKLNQEVCDFYGFDQSDQLRKKPEEFFEMWLNFFRDIQSSLPPKR